MNSNRNQSGPANKREAASEKRPINGGVPKSSGNNRTAPAPAVTKPAAVQKPAQEAKLQLTPEQVEINKANRKREIYYQKKKRVQTRKIFIARLTVFIAAVLVIGFAVWGIFWLNLTYSDSSGQGRYTYSIDDNKYKLNYNKAVRDGRVYVSFTDIAEMCDFSVMGSPEDMSFIIKGNDEHETVRFFSGSRTAYVNGVETAMGSACYFDDGEMYVPVEFVEAFVDGINISVNIRSREVTVARKITNLDGDGKLPKGVEPEYEGLSFLLKSAHGMVPLPEEDGGEVDIGLSKSVVMKYEEYMNPGSITNYLTLVNREYALSPDYGLTMPFSVSDTRKDKEDFIYHQLEENACMSLEAMFVELNAAGYTDVTVTKGFRSYSQLEVDFNQAVAENNYDREYVESIMPPPGYDEHQLGLSADLHNLPEEDVAFADTDAFRWLRDNCWKFGFILRYPEGKEEITGMPFEPWHFRYVGRFHAQQMYDKGLCLEEYLENEYPELVGLSPEEITSAGR